MRRPQPPLIEPSALVLLELGLDYERRRIVVGDSEQAPAAALDRDGQLVEELRAKDDLGGRLQPSARGDEESPFPVG